MSLKSAIIDYGALENLQSREGIEGFLIGAVDPININITLLYIINNLECWK